MKINRRKFLAGMGLSMGAGALAFDSFWWENEHPEVKIYTWPTAKWPKGAGSWRLVLISDLHLARFGSLEKRVAQMVVDQKPDMLVMAGDFIETKERFDDLKKFLALLPVNCPKVAVLGNWDHWSGVTVKDFDQTFAKLGIELLDNSSMQVKNAPGPFRVLGVDDPTNGWDRLPKALDKISSRDFNLFLVHSPNILDELKGRPIDLVLCGHTHGGQVHIPGVKPFWLPRGCEGYVSGFYRRDGIPMYVNRGIGTSIVPVRFLCRPEISVFNIRPAD